MNREEARKIIFIVGELAVEEKLNGKGATNSALKAYAEGLKLPLTKLDELLEACIKAGLIHKKLIGKRYYYRLGKE